MFHYDRKAYESLRDTVLDFKRLIKFSTVSLSFIIITTLFACYSAVDMRPSPSVRVACLNDSDCSQNHMCVKNISFDSTLGECVHVNNYDPWRNRRLEDIIKLKNKYKEEVVK